jgi:hypothetical protein
MQKERGNFLEKAYKGFDCSKNRGLNQTKKSEKMDNLVFQTILHLSSSFKTKIRPVHLPALYPYATESRNQTSFCLTFCNTSHLARTLFLQIVLVLIVTQTAFPQLSIQSFAPVFVKAGDTVTINGNGFSPVAGENFVGFNHINGQVVGSSSTQIKAIVPSGTSAGPIMVSKSGFSATSSQFFYPNVIPGNFPVENKSVSLAFERVFGGKVNYVQAADMDGDGLTDVIAGIENPGRIIIERNVSTSDSIKFADSVTLALGNNGFIIIEIAELNGDGKPDLVVISATSNNLRIFRNNSSPGNLSFTEQSSIAMNGISYDIAIADFDNDGKQDIATGPGTNSSTIEFFRNNSSVSLFSFSKVLFSPPSVPNMYYFTCGDYDNDGKTDFVASSNSTNALYILRNTSNGPGNFSFSSSTISPGIQAGFEAGTTDLNRDGKPDIVISSNVYFPKVFLNATTGNSIQFQLMNFSGNTVSEGFVSFTDLNTDGDPDLLIGSINERRSPGIYENLYPNMPLFDSSLTNLKLFLNAVGADFNQDGKTDLLCSGNVGNRYQVYINQSVPILIRSFSPTRATAGTPVTLKGEGFTNTTSVSFGNVNATSFQVLNDTIITAVVGNGASGNILVVANGNAATLAGFTYFTKPVLQSFSPAAGYTGSEVLLNGTNMQEVRAVRFGGVSADTFFIISNTQVRAIVGKGASGEVTVGGSAWDSSKLGGFTFFPAPDITGINSLKVPPGGEIILTGSYFNPLQVLTIGGIEVAPTSATPNTISFQAPVQYIGGNIFVKTPYGSDTLFGFYNGATISSVSPLAGKKGDTVTITGSGFISNPSAIYASIAKQKATVIEATPSKIKVIVPSGPATGSVSLSMNGHTVSGPLPFVFGFNNEGATVDEHSFQSFSPVDILKQGQQRNFKIADLDMDGKQDILQMTAVQLIVFRNTGQPGSFSFEEIPINNFEGYFITGFDIQDLNHDGKPEIIVNSNSGTRMHFLTNESNPGKIKFSDPQIKKPTQHNEYYNWFHDVDKDGRVDIYNHDYFYPNESPADSFAFNSRWNFYFPGTVNNRVAIFDMDNDGNEEVFSLQPDYPFKFYTINAMPGKINLQQSTTTIPLNCESFSSFAADLNNDGKIDLVDFCSTWTINIFKNTSEPGNIQFSESNITIGREDYFSIGNIGDFNGDGRMDFMTYEYENKLLYLFINSTSGSEITFLPPVTLKVFDYPDGLEGDYQMEVADLDNDGRVDILVSGKQLETVQIFRNLTGTQIAFFTCKDQPATLTTQRTGSSLQWQQSTNGSSYSNLVNGNGFTGVQSAMLNIAVVTESLNGKQFRCLVDGVPDIPFTIRLFNRWVGTSNNLWSNAGNWSCGTVPQGDVEVEIDSEVTIDMDVTIGKIVLKPGGNIIVAPGKKLTVLR